MKKIFLAAICLLLTLPAFASTFQYTYDGQTLNYETISDSECEVSNNPGTSGDVSIPEKVICNDREYAVTKIGWRAFENCNSLISISLPSSLESIGIRAFTDCSSLESITIPNSVTSIEHNAFSLCSSLRSVSLPPSSLTSIGNGVFAGCTSLESITIPNSVTSIGPLAFEYCLRLESITIPDSVTTIGQFAFNGCTALSSITLGRKLERIEHSAFDGCINLKNVTCLALIPPTVVTDQRGFSQNNCTLYVSLATWPLYLTSQWWKDFRSILPITKKGTLTIGDLKVSGSNGSIAVENAPIGSTVIVKDINNATVANEEIKEANQTINVNRKGIFIVNVDDATYKVAL